MKQTFLTNKDAKPFIQAVQAPDGVIIRVFDGANVTQTKLLHGTNIKGNDGIGISSIAKTGVSGNIDTYTITFTDGSKTTFSVTNGKDGEKGADGKDGADGYTPVRGTDYWTDADKAEMMSAVISALPVYDGEVVSV